MRGHARGRDDRGVVIVLVAASMVGLLMVAAVVVDLGNARQTKRGAQNAVDAAALAGAAVYDGSEAGADSARARAVEFLAANGRPTSTGGGPNQRSCTSPDVCEVQFIFAPTPSASAPAATVASRFCMRVQIRDLEVPTSFARVGGHERVEIDVESNGCKRHFAGAATSSIPAVLSLGTCDSAYEAFETSGNDNRFLGNIHSNGGARDTGTNNLREPATATATVRLPFGQQSDIDQLWVGATVVSADHADPLAGTLTAQQYVDQYKPGGTKAAAALAAGLYTNSTSDITFNGNIWAGIYYTTKKITVSGNNITVLPRGGHTGVILVSGGDMVVISGNGIRLTPFTLNNPERVTIVAGWDSNGNPCSDKGFEIGGTCSRVDGVMYVPFTKATFSGEGNGHDHNGGSQCSGRSTPDYSGALVAYSMKLDGNRHVVRGGVAGQGLDGEVFIDE